MTVKMGAVDGPGGMKPTGIEGLTGFDATQLKTLLQELADRDAADAAVSTDDDGAATDAAATSEGQGSDEGKNDDSTAKDGGLDVAALRSELAKTRREAAKYRTDLRKLEAANEMAKRAVMTETETLKADLAAATASLAAALEQQAAANVQAQVTAAATKANMHDPSDAGKHLDLEGLDVGEDGKVSGLDAALAALAKDKPYLFKTGKGGVPFGATNPAAGAQQITEDQLRAELFGGRRSDFWKGGGVMPLTEK